jgi:NAD(P)-dependent dehydrogenase (short-subunit alcohol dehydrogenase family)
MVRAMAEHFFSAWGEVGLLVNNPGMNGGGDAGDIPAEEWKEVIDANLLGVVHACHAFVPRMDSQGNPRLLSKAGR